MGGGFRVAPLTKERNWSMAKSELKLRHNVVIEVRGPDGKIKERKEHNLVTTAGKEAIATLLKEGTVRPKYLAVGTGTEEAKVGDTKLQTEKVRAEATTSVTGAVFKAEHEYAAGEAEGAITEEGILSAASEGTLFARTVFAAVNIGSEDTLKVTHTVTVE
jgi:hypothetical protein